MIALLRAHGGGPGNSPAPSAEDQGVIFGASQGKPERGSTYPASRFAMADPLTLIRSLQDPDRQNVVHVGAV